MIYMEVIILLQGCEWPAKLPIQLEKSINVRPGRDFQSFPGNLSFTGKHFLRQRSKQQQQQQRSKVLLHISTLSIKKETNARITNHVCRSFVKSPTVASVSKTNPPCLYRTRWTPLHGGKRVAGGILVFMPRLNPLVFGHEAKYENRRFQKSKDFVFPHGRTAKALLLCLFLNCF